jgi:predicted  nucleic acid-binding Zn-ribbon protein
MTVQIIVNCSNCGEPYNSTVLHFCPKCSCNVDLRSPTEQIQDTSKPKPIETNHFM